MAQSKNSKAALYALTGIVSGIDFRNDKAGKPYACFRFSTRVGGKDTTRVSMAFGKGCEVLTGLSEGDSATMLMAFDGGTFRMAGVPGRKGPEAAAA